MTKTNAKGLEGGVGVHPVVTAGGHEATVTEQPAFPDFHRKLADPTGFAWLAFGGALVLYGVTIIGARGINLFNAVVPTALSLGCMLLFFATVFETFPATLFGVYASFFGGFTVLHVSFFGLTGSYDGITPNTYAPGGAAAAEYASIQGLWISSESTTPRKKA
ncbi:hypothetical protein CBS101457_003704 [Exobasidium rhododendri]|nr:hypothetical protein CBS101457_003704 [Exobasidium rhododendri]